VTDPDYGGRGIQLRYTSFEQFLADVGPKPSPGHSLDRKDANGNYEPGNCRWATAKEQTFNRRIRRLEHFSTEEIAVELEKRGHHAKLV
jgi:hypothetical protein